MTAAKSKTSTKSATKPAAKGKTTAAKPAAAKATSTRKTAARTSKSTAAKASADGATSKRERKASNTKAKAAAKQTVEEDDDLFENEPADPDHVEDLSPEELAAQEAILSAYEKEHPPESAGDKLVTVDRRRQNVPVENDRRKPLKPRAKVARRRQIDPTTCERDYSDDEIEFMNALDDYKRSSGRMFPTCSEILEVIMKLGYVKIQAVESIAAESQSYSDERELVGAGAD